MSAYKNTKILNVIGKVRKMTALKTESTHIAYFSMEVGIDINLPTYSGGLGILAGDTIRSAADCEVPAVAVTLLHRKGYFDQMIDSEKGQSEKDVEWNVNKLLKEHSEKVSVEVAGKTVHLKAWSYDCLLYTSPSPRDRTRSRMPSSA